MASDVGIANLALGKLGAAKITSFADNSRNARSINNVYNAVRQFELRRRAWKFAIVRVILAPSATVPKFDFNNAFPLPTDTLRVLLPNTPLLDWQLESQDGVSVILTNAGTSVNLRYIQDVTDPNRFDALFIEAFASKLAYTLCEEITQSNEKKQAALNDYKMAIGEAGRFNAFERIPDVAPVSSWLLAHDRGSRWADTPPGTSITG